ncbi:phosphotransferase family protein [Geodermatophilus sp. DF01-2]|nr:phosphotransferase family protein [Geodermatophilus sp. DF01_2]
MAAGLERRLTALAGGPVRVEGLTRLTGGASRQTWALTAVDTGGGRRDLVLRSGAGTGGVELPVEGAAIAAAARAGVPVADVLDVGRGSGEDGLPPAYLLMARVDGETIPRRLLRDAEFAAVRPRLVHELAGVLARLHAVPLEELDRVPVGGDPLDRLATVHGGDEPPPPGLALGLRWLRENRPEPAPETLVHGDFRLGNLMIGPDGLRAVLDWELVHRGDPLEDLGWFCAKVWRFGSPLPAGGFGTREQLLDGYAEAAGWRPSAAQLHWWELYATVQWGLMTRVMTERHLSGVEPSVELAAIGRRAGEQEFDVLLSLGLAEPEPVPGLPGEDDDLLFGRPTAAELADAVASFLTADVRAGTGGRTAFLARVAANVLATVRRELLLGPDARIRRRTALDRLGCRDDAALADAITTGALDDRWDEVVSVVREGVRDRLLVANPRHLSLPA